MMDGMNGKGSMPMQLNKAVTQKNDWKMWVNYFYLNKFPLVITYKGISTLFVNVNNE